MSQQITRVPFNVKNPDLKAFSLKGKIVTARAKKMGVGWLNSIPVELTCKGKVYATGKARIINRTSRGKESNIWIFYHKQAGFETPEAWCKAFMGFRRGHQPKRIYVVEITNIKPVAEARQRSE